jgi:hypothetical protein
VEPAVLVDALGRGFGHLVVALHGVVAPAAEFAVRAIGTFFAGGGVADGNFHAGQGAADGFYLCLKAVIVAGLGHHR